MTKTMGELDDEFKKACAIVERRARSIGPECQIIFCDDGVSVALLSWAGDVVNENLYLALLEARASV